MTIQFMDMLWSINFRMGVGLDVEASSSRPVWITGFDNKIEAGEFDGLIFSIPFFVFTIGNVWKVGDA